MASTIRAQPYCQEVLDAPLTVNGTSTYFIYDGWDLIEERNSTGTVLATYVHGARQDEMLSKTTTAGTVYYQHNALGSVTDLTNASGTIVEKYKYDAFGKPAITDGSGNPLTASAYGNRFLFMGREYLAEVNLYDYRNRVYCADLGRFLQTDPIRFSAGDMNIYRYCGNNPLNLKDTSGLDPTVYSSSTTNSNVNSDGTTTSTTTTTNSSTSAFLGFTDTTTSTSTTSTTTLTTPVPGQDGTLSIAATGPSSTTSSDSYGITEQGIENANDLLQGDSDTGTTLKNAMDSVDSDKDSEETDGANSSNPPPTNQAPVAPLPPAPSQTPASPPPPPPPAVPSSCK